MRVSVFGLGYVGCVTAACLASGGHNAYGVDVDPVKLDLIRKGRSPIVEKGLGDLVLAGIESGRLRAGHDVMDAIENTDISFICVGTPSGANGSLDLRYVRRVAEQIGEALKSKYAYHLVVFRSTMLPGSVDDVLRPILEATSGKVAGSDFGVAYNPEFLREGSSIYDYYHPPRTVIGQIDERSGDALARVYGDVEGPVVRTTIRIAEMVKYVDNAFHALKITFANEIGNLCKTEGIDSHAVMDIFCLDTKLNLSPAYLRPGHAYGGSCLPKDLRALTQRARARDVWVPVLDAVSVSNEHQQRIALDLILAEGKKRVGVLGLSFKAGTDDLRESPTVALVERLIGKGYSVRIHDRNVSLASIFGSNRAYIEHEIPHISSIMFEDMGDVVEWAETVVVASRDPEYQDISRNIRDDQVAVDLVRLPNTSTTKGRYVGISW